MQEHPDPKGFHLSIVAHVAKLYLSTEKDPVFGDFRSPLAEQFVAKGLGEPDFAFFQDFPWCAGLTSCPPMPCPATTQ